MEQAASPLSADDYEALSRKIEALYNINNEVIEQINEMKGQQSKVVVMRKYTFKDLECELSADSKTAPASAIISKWRCASPPPFIQDASLNFFNDNLDYSVRNFSDVCRINQALFDISQKYLLLDQKKTVPFLRKFLTNLEVVQTLLGELHGCLMDKPALPDELQGKYAQLQEEWKKVMKAQAVFKRELEEWNSQSSCDPSLLVSPVRLNPGSVVGVGTVSKDGFTFSHSRADSVSVSSLEGYDSLVEFSVVVTASFESSSYFFLGVQSVPKAVSVDSRSEISTYGIGTTSPASGNSGSGVWTAGSFTPVGTLRVADGAVLKVTLDPQGRKFTVVCPSPSWSRSVDLPALSASDKWYLHFTPYGVNFKIVLNMNI
eukprot:GILI01015696.1.p1 GENE.GILI01015696.1~~GILI01015696.1.p1  ORF type:complete len:375 (-),score=75.65 GILI01015696.1:144-1268(-)